MKDRNLSFHIWRAIEAQAKVITESLYSDKDDYIYDENIEKVNEFELKRLHILINQLEEESPN